MNPEVDLSPTGLAKLQKLADEFRSDDWTSNYLAGATTALLAELVRLRAEHDRCEVLADRWSRYSASEYSSSDAPQAVHECARLLAAALVPVQHPTEEQP